MARRRRKRRLHWIPILLISCVLGFAGVITANERLDMGMSLPTWEEIRQWLEVEEAPTVIADADVSVHFVDVGQGDACLIRAGSSNVLIDAGDNVDENDIAGYLQAQEIQRLDAVFITHPHADHIGKMAQVIKEFEIGAVYMPQIPDEIVPTSYTYTNLLQTIKEKGLTIKKVTPGEELALDKGSIQMMGPVEEYEDLNDMSAVLKFTYEDASFLLTGDMEKTAERDLLESGQSMGARVIKLGHHGSSTSSSQAFLEAVDPSYAVISCGEGNKYNHPHTETLERMTKLNIRTFRTDRDGTVIFETDGKDISFQTVGKAG